MNINLRYVKSNHYVPSKLTNYEISIFKKYINKDIEKKFELATFHLSEPYKIAHNIYLSIINRERIFQDLLCFSSDTILDPKIHLDYTDYLSKFPGNFYLQKSINQVTRFYSFTNNVLIETPEIMNKDLEDFLHAYLGFYNLLALDLFFRYIIYFYNHKKEISYDNIIKASIRNFQICYPNEFKSNFYKDSTYQEILLPYIIKPRLLINGLPEELCDMLINLNMYL